MTQKVLIVGANKGVGLALAQVYQGNGYDCYLTARQASDQLERLNQTVIDGIDLPSQDALTSLHDQLPSDIDVYIHNAGLMIRDSIHDVQGEDLLKQFQVNALAPLLTLKAILPKLSVNAKAVFVSSRAGSIQMNTKGSNYGYKASKAALNSFVKTLSNDLEQKTCVAVHPGLVKTDMTKGFYEDHLLIDPLVSAKNLYSLIENLSPQQSGKFFDYTGTEHPW